jgi:hypothetical protein
MEDEDLFNSLMAEVSKNTIYTRIGRDNFIAISNHFYDKLFEIAPSMFAVQLTTPD